jgi:hypothetical protein
VGIAIIVVGYICATGLIIAMLRFTHKRDEAMHAVTAQWIEETSRA